MRLPILLFLVIFLSILQPVSSQSAGVSPGHYARYAVSGDPDFSENTTRSEFTVLAVAQAGANVTVSNTDTFIDGGTNTTTYWLNLVDGASNAPQGSYFLIFPGKQVGDPIYQDSSLTIERRENRRYANSLKLVNFAQFTEPTRSTAYYWDVETGIFTEIVVSYEDPGSGDLKQGLLVTMVETNLWDPDPPANPDPGTSSLTPYIAAALLGLGLVGGLLVYVRGRPKRERRR